jgi:hypothetical protein
MVEVVDDDATTGSVVTVGGPLAVAAVTLEFVVWPIAFNLGAPRPTRLSDGYGCWAGLTERLPTTSRVAAMAIKAGTITVACPVYSATNTTPVRGTA